MNRESLFEALRKTETIEEMANLLTEITLECSDCSSDGRECCKQCLYGLLKQPIIEKRPDNLFLL